MLVIIIFHLVWGVAVVWGCDARTDGGVRAAANANANAIANATANAANANAANANANSC